ncbi:MAG: Nif3-like dinuclear metal center hexameric protein [Ignavibacteriaceae bacterium]
MTTNELIKHIEEWVPLQISWEKDNSGFQVGSRNQKIRNVLLALELTPAVIKEAVKLNCNLIITHHPLLFHPLKKIDIDNHPVAGMVHQLIKNDIALYSAHTNLDFTKGGVSFRLAQKLRLKNTRFLSNLKQNQLKLAVFVPEYAVSTVADAIFNAGGGVIGDYTHCSFRYRGTGSFRGSEKTRPVVGKKERLEYVDEIKLEVLVNNWKLNSVINAVKNVHPYEEVAYDIYPLSNDNVNYGIGAVGNLPEKMTSADFLNYVAKSLKLKNFRYSGNIRRKIYTVAVCGGSGSELIPAAINQSADAFITADIKYHSFFSADEKLLLIDAGHYETEIFILEELKSRISKLTENRLKVYSFSGSTNPVIFFNN